MQIDNFISQVCENAHPPRKEDKWFRLSKFLEEFGEWRTEGNIKKAALELEDCFYTLALMSPFVEEVKKDDEFLKLDDMIILTWGLQIANKEDDEQFDIFYNVMVSKLCSISGLGKALQGSYERLVCDSIV